MPRSETDVAIVTLEGLLQAERHMIRQGEFGGLAELAAEKERQLARIAAARDRPDPTALADLRRRAQANLALLGAAVKGVRAARKRIDMILRASRSLTSYDRLGHTQTITGDVSTVQRRA